MLGLIDYVDRYEDGPVSGRAVGFGALIALGPLLAAVGDAHTFFNGWRVGTKLRAFVSSEVKQVV